MIAVAGQRKTTDNFRYGGGGLRLALARILQAYPYLEAQDIDAALAYAAWRLEEREEPLVIT